MTFYIVDAFASGDQRVASETIEADASDTALHQMEQRYPKATRFEAIKAVQPMPDTEEAINLMTILSERITGEHEEAATGHEGVPAPTPMWTYRRYLGVVREFMYRRAEAGEKPSQTLGVQNGAWGHNLLDRLIEMADDPALCRRQTVRLEEAIQEMKRRDR